MEASGGVIVAGIDPGKTGALVILYPDDSVQVARVPLMKLRDKEQPAWVDWAKQWNAMLSAAEPGMLVLERVASRPGQGVSSVFMFGQTFGFVRSLAALADCRLELATPSTWKGKFGLLKSDKNASRELARNLMPSLAPEITRVKDDGVAEAALLAWYGRKYLA